MTPFLVIFVNYSFLLDLNILCLTVVSLWYFWDIGIMGSIFNVFQYDLCHFVFFWWLKRLYS